MIQKIKTIAETQPATIPILIKRVRDICAHDSWDIRTAAGVILGELIQETMSSWLVVCAIALTDKNEDTNVATATQLSLASIDILSILEHASPLLKSGGGEYTYQRSDSIQEIKKFRARQRRVLLERIHIVDDQCESQSQLNDEQEQEETQTILPKLGVSTLKDIEKEIDLAAEQQHVSTTSTKTSVSTQFRPHTQGSHNKRQKLLPSESTAVDEVDAMEDNFSIPTIIHLFEAIFDAKWTIRHGSLIALRVIFKQKSLASFDQSKIAIIHQWLEECAVRCLCVLALDRYADFASEQTVIPIRELSAQCFTLILQMLPQAEQRKGVEICTQMVTVTTDADQRSNLTDHDHRWHIIHAGLLGIKYVLSLRQQKEAEENLDCGISIDLKTLLPIIMDVFEKHSRQEEIYSVIMEIFLQMSVEHFTTRQQQRITSQIWSNMQEAQTQNMMENDENVSCEFMTLFYSIQLSNRFKSFHHVHYLYEKWISHSILYIRKAAIQSLLLFFNQYQQQQQQVNHLTVLTHIFEQIQRETEPEIGQLLLELWKTILRQHDDQSVGMIPVHHLQSWFEAGFTYSIQLVSKNNYAHANEWIMEALVELMMMINNSCNTSISFLFHHLSSSSGLSRIQSSYFLFSWLKRLLSEQGQQQGKKQEEVIRKLHSTFDQLLYQLIYSKDKANANQKEGGDKQLIFQEQQSLCSKLLRVKEGILHLFQGKNINSSNNCLTFPAEEQFKSMAEFSRSMAQHVSELSYSELKSSTQFQEASQFRQRLFEIDEKIQLGFREIERRVNALVAANYFYLSTLQIPIHVPAQMNPILQAVMKSLKEETNEVLLVSNATTMSCFLNFYASKRRKAVEKVWSNLLKYLKHGQSEKGATFTIQIMAQQCQWESISELPVPIQERLLGSFESGSLLSFLEYHKLQAILCPELPLAAVKVLMQHFIEQLSLLPTTTMSSEQPTSSTDVDSSSSELAQVCSEILISFCQVKKNDRCDVLRFGMEKLFESVFPSLSSNVRHAGESQSLQRLVAARTLQQLCFKIPSARLIAFIPKLIMYAMQGMNDSREAISRWSSEAFSLFLPLFDLEMDDSTGQQDDTRAFLQDLMSGKGIPNVCSSNLSIEFDHHESPSTFLSPHLPLRDYQQHGLNWMIFLARNGLHGILADDMGLGKTLQMATCLNYSYSGAAGAFMGHPSALKPSLILCPATLVKHWYYEISTCFPTSSSASALSPCMNLSTFLQGPAKYNVLILSYAKFRQSYLTHLQSTEWHYGILDEGHVIRNPKSQLAQHVFHLRARHRMILSGTPVQNQALELWSAFEFLMPGYLGNFAAFQWRMKKPRNTEGECQDREILDQLQQRVAPFILRRTKDEVLTELPPKIISHIVCRMSCFQAQLYRALTTNVTSSSSSSNHHHRCGESTVQKKHSNSSFYTMMLLRKVLFHPALILDHMCKNEDQSKVSIGAQDIQVPADFHHSMLKYSGKFQALRDLLQSCGIGSSSHVRQERESSSSSSSFDDDDGPPVCAPHRCLVFAHFVSGLDLIQRMLEQELPRVTYLRLDGTVPASARVDIALTFQGDPSIDLLLLTTSVGSLGLTLTGADTVIFLEPSWNPYVDLQAMDRVHRLGQKRRVSVFRLLAEDSLDEHILKIQQTKTTLVRSIIHDIRPSEEVDTQALLRFLQESASSSSSQPASVSTQEPIVDDDAHQKNAAQSMLNQLEELWEESQYESLELR